MKWPTLKQLESTAKKASKAGFLLRLDETDKGWKWDWIHYPSDMVFSGECDSPSKPVALAAALMSVPVVK